MIQCQRCYQAPYKYNEGELCNAVLQSNWFNCAIKGFIIYPTQYLIGQLQMYNQVIEQAVLDTTRKAKWRNFSWISFSSDRRAANISTYRRRHGNMTYRRSALFQC